MSSLKPKHIDSDEEEEQAVEYIEITEKEKIRALRKAEKQRNNPSPNPPASQQPVREETNKPVPQKEGKKVIELKEVKEEKQKIEPAKKDNHNRQERRNEENEPQKDQEKKNKYQQKPNADKKEEVAQKPKYVQKPKNEAEEKIYYQNQRKYSAEVAQQQPRKITREVPKNRNQNDNIKGENVEVKVQDIQDEYDNQIYVNQKSVEQYLDLARDLIKRYDFIALKAYGNKIHKAFLIAGFIAEQFSQLKQINIPRTVNVSQTTRQGSSSKKRAAITIELSLKKLNKRHIGYQESDAEPREQYQNEKPQSRYVEKSSAEYSDKPKYVEKSRKYSEKSPDNSQRPSYKQKPASNNRANNNNSRFREKEEDERALR